MEKDINTELKEKNRLFFESINHIDGFYPEAEVMTYKSNNDTNRVIKRLPLSVKEIWFKAVYPDGVIKHKILKQDKDLVVVTCYLYRDYRDEENQFLRAETVAIAPVQSVKRDPNKGDAYFSIYSIGEIIQKTVNSAKSRSENYCLSKAGFGCQYETSYVEEEENLQDLEEKADEVLPQPSLPSSVPDTPKKNGVLGEVKNIMERDKSKPGPTDNGFVPSLSDREPAMPQKSILEYQKEPEITHSGCDSLHEDNVQENSIEDAFDFKPSDSRYQSLREVYDENPDRLLYMAKRIDGSEKEAILQIIAQDERLSAMAKRIGIVA